MAKTAQGFPVTQGSGSNLSLFELTNSRLRETVIIADSDADGEALHVELPAHGDTDRGSALKIGGKAGHAPPTAVSESTRTNAWFTLNGQQASVATIEPSYVYDLGRQAVNHAIGASLSNAGVIVPAAANLRTKVLAVYAQCVAFTSIGTLGLGGSGTAFYIASVTALNQNFSLPPSMYVYYTTLTNTDLSLFYSATASFNITVVYYQAPPA